MSRTWRLPIGFTLLVLAMSIAWLDAVSSSCKCGGNAFPSYSRTADSIALGLTLPIFDEVDGIKLAVGLKYEYNIRETLTYTVSCECPDPDVYQDDYTTCGCPQNVQFRLFAPTTFALSVERASNSPIEVYPEYFDCLLELTPNAIPADDVIQLPRPQGQSCKIVRTYSYDTTSRSGSLSFSMNLGPIGVGIGTDSVEARIGALSFSYSHSEDNSSWEEDLICGLEGTPANAKPDIVQIPSTLFFGETEKSKTLQVVVSDRDGDGDIVGLEVLSEIGGGPDCKIVSAATRPDENSETAIFDVTLQWNETRDAARVFIAAVDHQRIGDEKELQLVRLRAPTISKPSTLSYSEDELVTNPCGEGTIGIIDIEEFEVPAVYTNREYCTGIECRLVGAYHTAHRGTTTSIYVDPSEPIEIACCGCTQGAVAYVTPFIEFKPEGDESWIVVRGETEQVNFPCNSNHSEGATSPPVLIVSSASRAPCIEGTGAPCDNEWRIHVVVTDSDAASALSNGRLTLSATLRVGSMGMVDWNGFDDLTIHKRQLDSASCALTLDGNEGPLGGELIFWPARGEHDAQIDIDVCNAQGLCTAVSVKVAANAPPRYSSDGITWRSFGNSSFDGSVASIGPSVFTMDPAWYEAGCLQFRDLDGDALIFRMTQFPRWGTANLMTSGSGGNYFVTVMYEIDHEAMLTCHRDRRDLVDQLTVQAADPYGGRAEATMNIRFDVVNSPPVCENDRATTPSGTPIAIDVLANDSDPDEDVLTVAEVATLGRLAVGRA